MVRDQGCRRCRYQQSTCPAGGFVLPFPTVSTYAYEGYVAASSQMSGDLGPAGDSHAEELSDLEDLARMDLLGESAVRPPQTRRRRKQGSSAAEDPLIADL